MYWVTPMLALFSFGADRFSISTLTKWTMSRSRQVGEIHGIYEWLGLVLVQKLFDG